MVILIGKIKMTNSNIQGLKEVTITCLVDSFYQY